MLPGRRRTRPQPRLSLRARRLPDPAGSPSGPASALSPIRYKEDNHRITAPADVRRGLAKFWHVTDCHSWWDDGGACAAAARVCAIDEGIPMLEDLDPAETREWVDALDSVLAFEGADRAFFLLDEVIEEARRKGAPVPYSATPRRKGGRSGRRARRGPPPAAPRARRGPPRRGAGGSPPAPARAGAP